MIHITCNMGARDSPDSVCMPSGIHIRKIPRAHVTTITWKMSVHPKATAEDIRLDLSLYHVNYMYEPYVCQYLLDILAFVSCIINVNEVVGNHCLISEFVYMILVECYSLGSYGLKADLHLQTLADQQQSNLAGPVFVGMHFTGSRISHL